MSLESIISYGLTRPDEDHTALVLMGGGARTAYQAGVLQALGRMLVPPQESQKPPRFPFQLLVGTSAGALNACYLASRASQGLWSRHRRRHRRSRVVARPISHPPHAWPLGQLPLSSSTV